jgi:hypothetical protein
VEALAQARAGSGLKPAATGGRARAIERALARPDRSEAAAALAARSSWERVFEDELAALERLPRPVAV